MRGLYIAQFAVRTKGFSAFLGARWNASGHEETEREIIKFALRRSRSRWSAIRRVTCRSWVSKRHGRNTGKRSCEIASPARAPPMCSLECAVSSFLDFPFSLYHSIPNEEKSCRPEISYELRAATSSPRIPLLHKGKRPWRLSTC